MKISFATQFTVDLPEDTGKALASLIEEFINGVGAIMPLPTLTVKLSGPKEGDE